MFGAKWKLVDMIEDTIKFDLHILREDMIDRISHAKERGDSELAEHEFESAAMDHTRRVTNHVVSAVQMTMPEEGTRLETLVGNPSGESGHWIDMNKDMYTGSLYALCHYVMLGKPAKPRDISGMEQRHKTLIKRALVNL